MSSLNRTITGDALVRHLKRDEQTIDKALVAKHGRSARTLVKDGPLRLTLIALKAGGGMPTHSTEGPVSIYVAEGEATFTVGDQEYALAQGEVLVLAGAVEHAVSSRSGCVLLLTIVHLGTNGA